MGNSMTPVQKSSGIDFNKTKGSQDFSAKCFATNFFKRSTHQLLQKGSTFLEYGFVACPLKRWDTVDGRNPEQPSWYV